jgi:hypothetical protein
MVDPLYQKIAEKAKELTAKKQKYLDNGPETLSYILQLLYSEFGKTEPKASREVERKGMAYAVKEGYGEKLLKILNSKSFSDRIDSFFKNTGK